MIEQDRRGGGSMLIAGVAPAARVENLAMTETADEVLVYDTERHHIHHLNRTLTIVWRLLDGQRTISEVAAEARLQLGADISEQGVQLALAKLSDANLLDGTLSLAMRGSG